MKIFFKNVAKCGLAVCILLSAVSAANAQVVKGRVLDSASGDPLIGVTVLVDGTQNFAITDVNGNYTLKDVPVGKQKILFKMMGYASSVAELNVKAAGNRLNIAMSYQTYKQVVVTAKRISNTEAALLSKRKKAPVAQDAISAEQMSKSPDSDAADAAKRVTGVTIVDGKNVFIRGLGERYSSVMFGESVLPSPDPDKRVVPLDVFPTGLLDNLVIIKAYTPDMPGEFAGGIVQINPKDYPEEAQLKVSIGTGFHSNTTFKDFWTYGGGKYDFFGIDDGTRAMPDKIKKAQVNDSNYTSQEIEDIGESFNNEYTPEKTTAYLPASVSFTFGNSYKIGHFSTFGLIFSGMFKEKLKSTTSNVKRVNDNHVVLKDLDIEKSEYSTTKGLLLSLAFNADKNNKIRSTSFYSHNTSDSASVYEGYLSDRNEATLPGVNSINKIYKLQYIENGLFFSQLSGDHFFPGLLESKLEWTGSYSLATRDEPDTRTSQLIDQNATNNYTVYRIDDIDRYFQEHDESVYYFSPSLTIPFKQWSGLVSKLKMGGSYSYRHRDSIGREFGWQNDNTITYTPTPIEDIFNDTTIGGGASGPNAYFLQENSGSNNSYEADMTIYSGFGMIDMPLVPKLRLVGGLRYEYATVNIKSFDDSTGAIETLDTDSVKPHNYIPGVSLTYSATSKSNLRFAFSKTVARPDFREVTNGKYVTMLRDELIIGNPDLNQTDIMNFDFRWEWFPSTSEIMAFSVFYKYMENPIELLEVTGSGGTKNYQPFNAEFAHNLGAEIELRKKLGFISKAIDDFTFALNFAYIYSRISVVDTPLAKYTNENRPLQGQSPYIVNTSIDYYNEEMGFNCIVLFNISGPRIKRVGTVYSGAERGDVIEEPAPRLDFVLKQEVFTDGQVKLTVSNILDPEHKLTQKLENPITGQTKKFTLEKYNEGISVGLSYSHKL